QENHRADKEKRLRRLNLYKHICVLEWQNKSLLLNELQALFWVLAVKVRKQASFDTSLKKTT
ncbi:hypothetical protein, partial [Sphaerochaeta sp.]|uniref:hypothetical protein n=1 Tax=Sphaerochaeta sp. TaxID=1972642 RepID=UPI002FCC2E06